MAKEAATRILCILITALIAIILAVAGFGFSSIEKVDEKKLDRSVYDEHKEVQIRQEARQEKQFDKIDKKLDKIIEKI